MSGLQSTASVAEGEAKVYCYGYHLDDNWYDTCSGMNLDFNTVNVPTTNWYDGSPAGGYLSR